MTVLGIPWVGILCGAGVEEMCIDLLTHARLVQVTL